jgi:antitoxin HigA-1
VVLPGRGSSEEVLNPLKLTAYRSSQSLQVAVPPRNEIVRERRGIAAEAAICRARYFGPTEQFSLHLQSAYEVDVANAELCDELEQRSQRIQ